MAGPGSTELHGSEMAPHGRTQGRMTVRHDHVAHLALDAWERTPTMTTVRRCGSRTSVLVLIRPTAAVPARLVVDVVAQDPS